MAKTSNWWARWWNNLRFFTAVGTSRAQWRPAGPGLLSVFDSDVERRIWVKGKFTGYNISKSKVAKGGEREKCFRSYNDAQKSTDQIQLQLSCTFLPFGSLCCLCHRQDQHGCGAKSWSSTSCISFVAQFMLFVTVRTTKSWENPVGLQYCICWTSHCGPPNRCSRYNFHRPKIEDLHWKN